MNREEFQTMALAVLKDYGVDVAKVLLLLLFAWFVAGWVKRFVERSLTRVEFDATLTKFFASTSRWLVLLLAVLGCLGIFGVETTSFAAVIGAAGLALGLAFQGTLSNFAAGIMLLVFRPFKVDDVVTIAGQTGKIHSIELFTSALDTFDNRRFVIPNSAIFGTVIENITHHPIRRAEVSVGVDYAADIDRTRSVLTSAACQVPGRLEDPAPAIVLVELGASSVNWSVRVWAQTSEFGDVKQATIRSVKMALDEAEIGIPFPQMDVHLDQPA
ncbi:MAG: mechanosensitive ion channel [Pirellulaceae bacterium]|nr:mechanosensitive ion channel [Pirellulaceae bacterium]HJN07288.1 mechanosensitive ion channel [Pirellulaceae bacterium]